MVQNMQAGQTAKTPRGFERFCEGMENALSRLGTAIEQTMGAFAPTLTPDTPQPTSSEKLPAGPCVSEYQASMNGYISRINADCEALEALCSRSEI
jgi:hypothetical protein